MHRAAMLVNGNAWRLKRKAPAYRPGGRYKCKNMIRFIAPALDVARVAAALVSGGRLCSIGRACRNLREGDVLQHLTLPL